MPPKRPRDDIPGKTKILLVDDHPIVRERLTELIHQQDDLVVCGEAENAQQAMEAIARTKPDLAIVDLSMKGKHGIELVKDIRAQCCGLPVLVLSMHDESLYAERVLRAGARGYITKQEATQKILHAIRTVLKGQVYLSEQMAAKVLRGALQQAKPGAPGSPLEELTDRELEVFELIGQGFGTREISDRLHIDIKTVESHKAHLKEKLNIDDAGKLLQYAIQWAQGEAAR